MSNKMDHKLVDSRVNVLGVGVSATNMDEAVKILLDARTHGQSGYVCVTGVHGVIESQRDPELKKIHNRSFLTVPDGMPTVWMGREQGFMHMGRVYGPDLMLKVFEATVAFNQKSADRSQRKDGLTADLQVPVSEKMSCTHFLYGATEETLKELKTNLETRFPGVQIVGTYAPPFRPLNEQEETELRELVASCKPDFFWVGLSTPKQEKFMASHDPRLSDSNSQIPVSNFNQHPLDAGIMLGVGAAFDIHAGHYKDSPEWIKNSGLQWLHRLCNEPRRLWRRYLTIVPAFLWLSAMQLLGVKKYTIEK